MDTTFNFFDFLQLNIELFKAMLATNFINETYNGTRYVVSFGGFLLAVFLLGVVLRLLFSISGILPNISISRSAGKVQSFRRHHFSDHAKGGSKS